MSGPLPRLLETLAAARGLALATVVETEGSTPQAPGASAVFSAGGLVAGTVGGGVLESRVQAVAGLALDDGRCRLLRIRLDTDLADKDGALCGGQASILLDPLDARRTEPFRQALESLRTGTGGVLAAIAAPVEGDEVEVSREWLPGGIVPEGSSLRGLDLPSVLTQRVLASGRAALHRADRRLVFLEPVRPLPRLIIAGAGHVGRALAHLGRRLDFEVTVIDDRSEFANPANVPDADTLVVGDMASSVRAVPDSPDNYFVVVTRGHALDAQALRACLGRPAAYVGMIGSRRKVEAIRRDFLDKGWAAEDEWDRVHTPIGLEIGSKTVEEIAVSIAAQLVLVRSVRGREEGP